MVIIQTNNFTPTFEEVMSWQWDTTPPQNIALSEIFGNYPIWNESDRTKLNEMIYQHYRFRQIGAETIDRWIAQIQETMKLIMPNYVTLYNLEYENVVIGGQTVTKTEYGEQVHNFNGGKRSDTNTYGEQITDSEGAGANTTTPENSLSLSLTNLSGYATTAEKSVGKTINESHTDTKESNPYTDTDTKSEYTNTTTVNNTDSWIMSVKEFADFYKNIFQQIVEDKSIAENFMTIY